MKKFIAKLAEGDLNQDACLTQQHSAFIGKQLTVGNQHVVIEDVIAEGGFSLVFRARASDGRIYALKRMCVNDAKDLAVAKQEIELLKSLNHRTILHYIGSSIVTASDGVHKVYLLTDFYPGSVIQLMKTRQQKGQFLLEGEILRILSDVCQALACLHHQPSPVIHRDLKVENLLIDSRNNFVLCDFGSATSRVMHPKADGVPLCEEELTKYTTVSYRSPEMVDLFRDQPIDTKSDMWALGCLLYYLCFFTLPFGESTLAISAGNFTVPDDTGLYKNRLLKLIALLLRQSPSERPDVFQTSSLAASLMTSASCPVNNFNRSSVPSWDSLPMPVRETEAKLAKAAGSRSGNTPAPLQLNPVSTSVAPRQRPKAGGSAAINRSVASTNGKPAGGPGHVILADSIDAVPVSSAFEQTPVGTATNTNLPDPWGEVLLPPATCFEGTSGGIIGVPGPWSPQAPPNTPLTTTAPASIGSGGPRSITEGLEEFMSDLELSGGGPGSTSSTAGGDDLMSFTASAQRALPAQVAAALARCSGNNSPLGKSFSSHDVRPGHTSPFWPGGGTCARQQQAFPHGVSMTPSMPGPSAYAGSWQSLPGSVSVRPPVYNMIPSGVGGVSTQKHRRLVSDTSAITQAGQQAPGNQLLQNHASRPSSGQCTNALGFQDFGQSLDRTKGLCAPSSLVRSASAAGQHSLRTRQMDSMEDSMFGEEFDKLRSTCETHNIDFGQMSPIHTY